MHEGENKINWMGRYSKTYRRRTVVERNKQDRSLKLKINLYQNKWKEGYQRTNIDEWESYHQDKKEKS